MFANRERVTVIKCVTYTIADDLTFDLYNKAGIIVARNKDATNYRVLFTIADCIKLKVWIPASSLVKEDHELWNW